MKLTLQEIANLVNGSIDGNNSKEIYGLNSLENANLFKKNTYDWINRSFRSNIPFED